MKRLRILPFLAASCLAAIVTFAADDPDELRLAIVVTRHGVRSPLQANEQLNRFSLQPWPQWPVAPGILTQHGYDEMVLMGKYYRDRYVAAGLLTGTTADDAPAVYFNADNDERTITTAKAIAAGLIPGATPEVIALPKGKIDPIYRPAQVPVGHPDKDLAVAAALGRVGGDARRLDEGCSAAFAELRRVLYGPTGVIPAEMDHALASPSRLAPGTGDHTVRIIGGIDTAHTLIDALLLEYTEGMPMVDVGWGRLSREQLTQILELHALSFDLTAATFTAARIQGSNLAAHLRDTLDQAVAGAPRAGAFASPKSKVVVLVGHDTNILNLAGMLGLNWRLPGAQLDPVLPGGALVLELRRHRSDGRYYVNLVYLSQTLDQTRTLEPLTLDHPPALAPIFVPGCSENRPDFGAPLEQFEATLQRVIDPAFVTVLPY